MDAISEPNVDTVVMMSSAQVGKTELLLNLVGYHIHLDPGPILMVQPTKEMAETFSKDRLAPMIRDTPVLASKIKSPKSRDSGNTLQHKRFPGGQISLMGANSPSDLSSRPIRIVLCDEVDRYPASAGTEGDPVSLAVKRTNNFANRRILLMSTPTIKGISRIEKAFFESDQRHYHVPCPHCGEFQTLQWELIRWQQDKPDTAIHACKTCGCEIEESARPDMLAKGKWIAENPSSQIAGFHINELYSPWRTWEQVVKAYLIAKKGGSETLQTWFNTVLGKTWEMEGEGVDGNQLLLRREKYPGQVPDGAKVITVGVDVQDDRLEAEAVGWSKDKESWSLDYQVFHGDPGQSEVWDELDNWLFSDWLTPTKHRLKVSSAFVDSGGHHTQRVYEYCRDRVRKGVFAIKGRSGLGRPIISSASRVGLGSGQRAVYLYTGGVDTAKEQLYSRLQIEEPGPGYCHFPLNDPPYNEQYFDQLTAERLTTHYIKGSSAFKWVLPSGKRNEALDCRVYATAALERIFSQFDRAAENVEEPTDAKKEAYKNRKWLRDQKEAIARRPRIVYSPYIGKRSLF